MKKREWIESIPASLDYFEAARAYTSEVIEVAVNQPDVEEPKHGLYCKYGDQNGLCISRPRYRRHRRQITAVGLRRPSSRNHHHPGAVGCHLASYPLSSPPDLAALGRSPQGRRGPRSPGLRSGAAAILVTSTRPGSMVLPRRLIRGTGLACWRRRAACKHLGDR